MPEPTPTAGRRRALIRLTAITTTALAVLSAVAALLYGPGPGSAPEAGSSATGAPQSGDETGTRQDRAEYRLALRPMPRFPPSAAQRQPLADRPAGPPIRLPEPKQAAQPGVDVVPSGYDVSPRGALARLAAITEAGLRTGTPQGYAQLYGQVSEPGAATPGRSWMAALLRGVYRGARVDPADPAEQLAMRFTPTHGLIKGAVHNGEYVVACVLGEFTVSSRGQSTTVGLGDCQALRHTGRGWLIASGTPAYPAPSVWPGSQDSVDAGYRELRR